MRRTQHTPLVFEGIYRTVDNEEIAQGLKVGPRRSTGLLPSTDELIGIILDKLSIAERGEAGGGGGGGSVEPHRTETWELHNLDTGNKLEADADLSEQVRDYDRLEVRKAFNAGRGL